jgi:hypothetical protein
MLTILVTAFVAYAAYQEWNLYRERQAQSRRIPIPVKDEMPLYLRRRRRS